MIPCRMSLRNFMPYQELELNFEGLHLACLTGENGAGKSTLLDAITWAIWGKARAKSDDQLVHQGKTEMEVDFTFEISETTYRIIRRRLLGKTGRSELHFMVLRPPDDWRNLDGNTMRETQELIEQRLKLDYETFINSAFLLQGRADEFTVRAPGERKRILGEILDLKAYDLYEGKAKEKAAGLSNDIALLTAQIQQIDRELAREPEYQAELAQAEEEAKKAAAILKQSETELEVLRQQRKELETKNRHLADLRQRLDQAGRDQAGLEKDLADGRQKLAECRLIIGRKEEIEAGYALLEAALIEEAGWKDKLRVSYGLKDKRFALENSLEAAKSRLENELKNGRSRADELAAKAGLVETTQAEITRIQETLDSLQAKEAEKTRLEEQLSELQAEAAGLNAQTAAFRLEMDELKEKIEQLEAAGAVCPVCARPLEESHRQSVLHDYQARGKEKGDAFRAAKARLEEIAGEQAGLKKSRQQLGMELEALPSLRHRLAGLEISLRESEKAAGELPARQAEISRLQQSLEKADYALDDRRQLRQVLEELENIGYDESRHQAASQKLLDLKKFEQEKYNLGTAFSRLDELQALEQRALERLQRLAEQQAADSQQAQELEKDIALLPELGQQLNLLVAQVDDQQKTERQAHDQVTALKQLIGHCHALAADRVRQEKKLLEAREAQGLYRELQEAFGKKGIQAMLIEHALPEIENEANNILAKMTEGRMNVRFLTQRDAKSSNNVIETLDILISDEIGTRNYEMFSGGEAFRVNFAIRIALSKLLARRAGARLRTLFIDEGFGTQDAAGRERLIEAINMIQNDFDKIFVITHIDELKDAFPARIEIEKGEHGSVARLI